MKSLWVKKCAVAMMVSALFVSLPVFAAGPTLILPERGSWSFFVLPSGFGIQMGFVWSPSQTVNGGQSLVPEGSGWPSFTPPKTAPPAQPDPFEPEPKELHGPEHPVPWP